MYTQKKIGMLWRGLRPEKMPTPPNLNAKNKIKKEENKLPDLFSLTIPIAAGPGRE
jgi:hypothetical protein